MIFATWHLWQAAGRPAMPATETGTCRVCGEASEGVAFDAWVRDTFTDHDKLRPGAILCQACQFAFEEASALLAGRVGKDKPQRMRNYSHFVTGGEWVPLSKGDKRRMTDLLLHDRPEVAVIAVSGQKHIIFRALPGWWQVEELTARPFPERLAVVLEMVGELYNGGFSKTEIETGRYLQHRIVDFGFEHWRRLNEAINLLRGSNQLNLALFLAQKEEMEDGQVRDGENAPGADLARHPGRLQEPLPAQHLAAIRGQRKVGGLHVKPVEVRQQSLFEAAGDDPGR